MSRHTALTDEELATLAEADLPSACVSDPTASTAKLVAIGLIRATPLGFYTTRAGKLRLANERLLQSARLGIPPRAEAIVECGIGFATLLEAHQELQADKPL